MKVGVGPTDRRAEVERLKNSTILKGNSDKASEGSRGKKQDSKESVEAFRSKATYESRC